MTPWRFLPPRGREVFAALLLAAGLTVLVDAFTAHIPPRWDADIYLDMARNGLRGNDHLMAPFAYRPGTPFLARAVAEVFSLSLADGFLWVTRCGVASFLFLAFLLARRFTGSPFRAAAVMLFAATLAMPVKFALFFPSMIDGTAYPLMLLAMWAWTGNRFAWCLAISAVGVLFKEFLAIPLLLCLVHYAREWGRRRAARDLAVFTGAALLAAAVILVPRLVLDVASSHQEIDPLNNRASAWKLVQNPLRPAKWANIVFNALGFWLPFLLLWTRARGAEALRGLGPLRPSFAAFAFLNLVLVVYGGTNLPNFVAYSAPLLLAFLARLFSLREHPVRPVEGALALACMILWSRLFFEIPRPGTAGFGPYIDFYAGWHERLNGATAARVVEMGLYLVLLTGARRFLYSKSTAAS